MCGMWCVVCGVWRVVCGEWYVVCGMWYVVCGMWYAVGMRYVVCGAWYVVCGMWHAVRRCPLSRVGAEPADADLTFEPRCAQHGRDHRVPHMDT